MLLQMDTSLNDTFIPRDFQVELFESAKLRNTIVCLKAHMGKTFIAVMLVREKAHEVMRPLSQGGSRIVFLTPIVSFAVQQSAYLRHHTPLRVGIFHKRKGVDQWDKEKWMEELERSQVLVMTYQIFMSTLQQGFLSMEQINLLVLDECHNVVSDSPLKEVVLSIGSPTQSNRTRVLGLTSSIVNNKCKPVELARIISNLESSLKSVIHTSNNVLSALQHSTQPKELICETNSTTEASDLEKRVLERVQRAIDFLKDHRYDPSEYYGEQDYLKEIPNPCSEPLTVLEEFLHVITTFGPWGADRAALVYLIHLEKLKTRAVYERHYLLLCLVFTVLLEVRAMCEEVFHNYTEYERIMKFTRPKVLRLLEILRLYRPPAPVRADPSQPFNNNPEEAEYPEPTAPPVVLVAQASEPVNVESVQQPIVESVGRGTLEDVSPSVGAENGTGSTVAPPPDPQPDQPADVDSVQPSIVAPGAEASGVVETGPEEEAAAQMPIDQPTAVEGTSNEAVPPGTDVPAAEAARGAAAAPGPAEKGQSKPTAGTPHFSRRRRADFMARHQRFRDDMYQLCGIIFVERRTTAKLLYHLLKDASRCDAELAYLSPLYTVGRSDGMSTKELETEERKQEDVMKRFRSRDCNVLVATSVLEEGIDVPACHLVVRYDLPQTYRAYVHSKARARARKAHYVLMAHEHELDDFLVDLSQFHATEQMLLRKCGYHNLIAEADYSSDDLERLQAPYSPSGPDGPSVSLNNSISIVNRYCAKLPSDSFTRLAPVVQVESVDGDRASETSLTKAFQCSLLLPINSQLRQTVRGAVMPSKVLAKRSVALETCRQLHRLKELDDHFLPIGKENLRLEEEEDYNADLEEENVAESNTRPGTTKRRQYYYKQVADSFTRCLPDTSRHCYLYAITMVLTEPIPEEQNTRGRKIYKPETSTQSLGLLTSKPMPQICPFPIFTRSGEVEVDVVRVDQAVSLDAEQLQRVANFQRYIFKNVLSLEKDPMLFDPLHADCSYLIVPLRRTEADGLTLDLAFVDLISSVRNAKPQFIADGQRAGYVFQPAKFQDTVVLRWYRDQEHPQCFYVAEIFYELNPQSKFPDNNYPTFEKYYRDKYGIQIQNLKQPLLDVDHTSARLNFLTPRYVNRKGVMLPTSTEHTKKTQRESLQQKQILVPELCSIHPFSASLWRQAVCLPCILYRLNGLLLAEKLRCQVATEICLGRASLDREFRWPPLRFGWKRKTTPALPPAAPPARPASSSPPPPAAAAAAASDAVDSVQFDDKITATPAVKPVVKTLKRDAVKEQKKSSSSSAAKGAVLNIGVWNPNASDDAVAHSVDGDGANEEYYDYNDLQAVALLTNDNTADFDWDKKIADPIVSNASLSTFKVGSPSCLQSWDDPSGGDNFSDFRPKSPSEFVDDYSDDDDDGGGGGSYNSDQSLDDSDTDSELEDGSDGDEEEDDNCRVKEFGPKLVCRGDTAEAVEEPNSSRMKKKKSPEEEEMDEADQDDDDEEDNYRSVEDLLSLSSQWSSSDPASPALESRCQELLQNHRRVLIDESLVAKERQVPIAPPFANKLSASVHDAPPAEPKSADRAAARLASQSPYILELAQLLLGEDVHAQVAVEAAVETAVETVSIQDQATPSTSAAARMDGDGDDSADTGLEFGFSFDEQPDLENHPGPSPSVILQAFTMSSANDGINLERLETIGDSFLKYAITTYLYCKYSSIHEGKLSYLRSRQVSNLHLYQLGKRKLFGGCMVATKFNPHDNWLPPGYVIPDALEEALITSGVPLNYWNVVDLQGMEQLSSEEVRAMVKEKTEQILSRFGGKIPSLDNAALEDAALEGPAAAAAAAANAAVCTAAQDLPRFVPYNLLTQHSIPDKSIADCVEALIGAYLTGCGPRGALLFMSWLGLKVLPVDDSRRERFGYWSPPVSPLLNRPSDADAMLHRMLAGFEAFEEKIGYRFNDRYYLLQAFSHASYYPNRLTDCYQRLEFLGDAVLDYLITRYLYEDPRQHPPGALTDLRSALVNNTTFAVLAVRYEFHRFFKHFSHTLNQVMDKFIKAQEGNGHCINEEYYLIEEGESEEAEDVEVPKALGDVFESVAGAIYLDSKMSLNTVWKVYYRMMKKEIEEFSKNVPKSPIRELLELETDRVKFGKAERLPDGRVRVTVDVIGKGTFKGIGRNYRIAKCTAAKFALRTLEKRKMLAKRGE